MTQPGLRRFPRRANQWSDPKPLPGISDELAADLISRRNDGYSFLALVTYSGVPENAVANIVGARVRGNYRRQLAYYRNLDVPRWSPDCMSAEELEAWSRRTPGDWSFPPRVCDDCPLEFALANRYVGTCNGTLPHERFDSGSAFRGAA